MKYTSRLCLLLIMLLSVAVCIVLHLQLTKKPSHSRTKLQPPPNRELTPSPRYTAHEGTTPTPSSGESHAGDDSFRALFSARLRVLGEKCRALRPKAPDLLFQRIVLPKVFSACVPYKVGSSSWEELKRSLGQLKKKRKSKINIICVRNPWTRLESAYRDKFLGGGALSAYTDSWRRVTHSEDSWLARWDTYWLLALISRGDVTPTRWITERYERMNNADNLPRSTLMTIAEMRVYLYQEYGQRMAELRRTFSKTKFSFEDYLNFVLWSYDMGVVDYNWASVVDLCEPCHHSYDYVVHLEDMRSEMSYLLDVLRAPKGTVMPHRRSSRDLFYRPKSGYYKHVSNMTLMRILDMYKYDFELFGYDRLF